MTDRVNLAASRFSSRSARRLLPSVTVLLLAVSCGGSHHATDASTTGSTSTSTTSTLPPSSTTTSSLPTSTTSNPPSTTVSAAPSTSSTLPPPSSGWAVAAFHTAPNANGEWSGTAQIRNAGTATEPGNFVFTISRDGGVIAVLTGSVGATPRGTTADVVLSSNTRYTSGAYSYTFSASFGF